jgi:hypothetical protein
LFLLRPKLGTADHGRAAVSCDGCPSSVARSGEAEAFREDTLFQTGNLIHQDGGGLVCDENLQHPPGEVSLRDKVVAEKRAVARAKALRSQLPKCPVAMSTPRRI